MKKSKKQIFLLYSCDEWKSTDSLRLVCATTSPTKMKMAIASMIEAGEMEYFMEEDTTDNLKKAAKRFREDWKYLTRRDLNNYLKYGFYDYAYDGELCC